MASSIDDRLNQIIRELIGNGLTVEQAVAVFEEKYRVAAMSAARAEAVQSAQRPTPSKSVRSGPRKSSEANEKAVEELLALFIEPYRKVG